MALDRARSRRHRGLATCRHSDVDGEESVALAWALMLCRKWEALRVLMRATCPSGAPQGTAHRATPALNPPTRCAVRDGWWTS